MITEQQKTNIINALDQLDSLDIPQLLKDSTGLGLYSVDRFSTVTKRMIIQLKEELINGIGEYLPYQYNYPLSNQFLY